MKTNDQQLRETKQKKKKNITLKAEKREPRLKHEQGPKFSHFL